MTNLNSNCVFSIPEDAPRTPDRDDLALGYERGIGLWNEEYWRRMNTDESKVPPFTLPPIPDTLAEWEAQRPKILQDAKDCIYGVMPPPPDKLELKLLAERKDALNGTAIRREYRIYCSMNNGKKFDFDMMLYVPLNAAVPPPVFVSLNFAGNQGNSPDMDIRTSRSAGCYPTRCHSTGPNRGQRGEDLGRTNYAECIRRGYAIATACYGEIFPDNLDGFRKSIFSLFYDDLRPDCEISIDEIKAGHRRNMGAYGGWAWGYSRIADALQQIPLVNADKMACVGHSRLGSTSMWAGINDKRFKLVCVNNSGMGGAPLARRNFGARLSILAFCRPNWACDRIIRYVDGLENELPFDSHQLLGLIAPRALYVTSSSKDLNADPKGTFLATMHASKVWELYGLKGLGVTDIPEVDHPIGNMVRYHVKTGPHSITPYDWEQYYNFADELFGKPAVNNSTTN